MCYFHIRRPWHVRAAMSIKTAIAGVRGVVSALDWSNVTARRHVRERSLKAVVSSKTHSLVMSPDFVGVTASRSSHKIALAADPRQDYAQGRGVCV